MEKYKQDYLKMMVMWKENWCVVVKYVEMLCKNKMLIRYHLTIHKHLSINLRKTLNNFGFFGIKIRIFKIEVKKKIKKKM